MDTAMDRIREASKQYLDGMLTPREYRSILVTQLTMDRFLSEKLVIELARCFVATTPVL